MANYLSFLVLFVVIYNIITCQESFENNNQLTTEYPVELEPVIIPATGNHTTTMIFLHHMGDNGERMVPFAKKIQKPNMKIILPTAATIPISSKYNLQMRSWYDVGNSIDVNNAMNSVRYIRKLIEQEIESGTPSERIILAGFCSGAALALHSAQTFPKKLGAAILFSPKECLDMPRIAFMTRPNREILKLNFYGRNIDDEKLIHTVLHTYDKKGMVLTIGDMKRLSEFFNKNFP